MLNTAGPQQRDRDWLAFVLPVLGFCVVDCLAAVGIVRSGAELTWGFLFGAFMGQMLWGAAWCALGPGRWVHRFIAVVATGVLVAGVMLAGVYSQNETPPPDEQVYYRSGGMIVRITRFGPAALTPRPRETARTRVLMGASAFPLALLIAQFPILGMRATRGWQIAYRETGGVLHSSDSRSFGIGDLFVATAAVAIALGFWRIQWSIATNEMLGGLALFVGWAVVAFIAGLLALMIVPLALGARPQRLSLKLLLCAYILLLGVIPPAAAVLMAYPSFWVARDVGYRLVGLKRT